MMSELKITTVLAAIVALAAGCNKPEAPREDTRTAPPAPAATTAVTAKPSAASGKSAANKIFKERCVVCHGQDGKGDGPGAAALNPKPRNYTDAAWQKSVTDEAIGKTILYGGAAVGKSPNMPANPDLESKPEVVEALVAVVRGFGKS